MVTIVTKNNSSSCTDSKMWLKEQGITFKELKADSQQNQLTRDILVNILTLCDSGINQIIKPQRELPSSLAYLVKHFESLSFNAAMGLILKYPGLLVTPILFDVEDQKIQLGYNKDDMRKFLPRQE